MRKNLIVIMIVLIFVMIMTSSCGNQKEDPSIDYAPAVGISSFNTTDIYGEVVTQEIFQDYELTMVNVWGTFCGPCIDEMPSLGEIQKEYQDKGVNIVGIVVDVQDGDLNINPKKIKLAIEIAEMTGADYIHMIVSPELLVAKIGEIDAIPASFFVDREGNFVGDTYVGARDKEAWIDIIEKTLEN